MKRNPKPAKKTRNGSFRPVTLDAAQLEAVTGGDGVNAGWLGAPTLLS